MGTVTDWASWANYRNLEIQTSELPAGGDLPCAMFFPADYSIGMANLGFHYIYRTLREAGVSAERFFTSPIPYRSVERDTMLERFPLIFCGVSYEADILAFVNWLRGGGIDPLRTEREIRGSGETSLIGAGGAMTYINPLPLGGICDFVALGDGVETTRFLVDTMRKGLSRSDTLDALAEHGSIFVPSRHERGDFLLKPAKDDISSGFGRGLWTTPHAAFGNTLLLELQRGCARGCAFCVLPSCFGPMRQRALGLVKRDIEEASAKSDFSRIGFVTPEAGDYMCLDDLLEFAEKQGMGVSFASLRVDHITERMMSAVVRGGRHSVTIAPESGSEALRGACGKHFPNRLVIEKLAMAKDFGARSAKLYFMVGLPGETDDDVLSISKLCSTAREETGLQITAAVSPFIPKAGTAWAKEEFAGEKKLKRAYSLLSKSFGGIGGVRLHRASIREARVEYDISWTSSRTAGLLAGVSTPNAADKRAVYQEFERLGLHTPD